MDILDKESGIFGSAGAEGLNQSFEAFFDHAREIRIRLGRNKGLLDEYLSLLFDASAAALSHNMTPSGLSAAGQLSSICVGEVMGRPQNTYNAFYHTARDYIRSHPLFMSDPHTKTAIYTSRLCGEFSMYSAKQFFDKMCEKIRKSVDCDRINELNIRINRHLREEEPMQTLDRLFRERFLISAAMAIYLQGITTQLIYSLSCYDSETRKKVFQILMDSE